MSPSPAWRAAVRAAATVCVSVSLLVYAECVTVPPVQYSTRDLLSAGHADGCPSVRGVRSNRQIIFDHRGRSVFAGASESASITHQTLFCYVCGAMISSF